MFYFYIAGKEHLYQIIICKSVNMQGIMVININTSPKLLSGARCLRTTWLASLSVGSYCSLLMSIESSSLIGSILLRVYGFYQKMAFVRRTDLRQTLVQVSIWFVFTLFARTFRGYVHALPLGLGYDDTRPGKPISLSIAQQSSV